MAYGLGSPDGTLSAKQIRGIIGEGMPEEVYRGKRVLVLTPDTTRTCPLPRMIDCLFDFIGSAAARVDFMVALGTHTPLSEERLLGLYGISSEDRAGRYRGCRFLNHRWDLPDTLSRIGWLEEDQIAEITSGLLRERVPVDINRAVFDYDLVLILGPVFPHEVVGYSGGAKYLFPGISGGEFLHSFHWLGALATCPGIIGIKDTPVRGVINRAMSLVTTQTHCLAMVVKSKSELYGLYAGDCPTAWSEAADLSRRVHVKYTERTYHTVLGTCSQMYDEVWTGGKVMYKLEQVVADGGRLIIYAPHITEISRTWGEYIQEIGYHVRDYFLEEPERFKGIPRGVLAHSTHVRGVGRMENGVEKPRIDVILASGVGPEVCERINLGYLDPKTIDPDEYRDREDDGVLLVENAGEILHLVKP